MYTQPRYGEKELWWNGGKAGFGIYNRRQLIFMGYGESCNILQAKLLAITHCCEKIEEIVDEQSNVCIYTDSMAALQSTIDKNKL